MLNRKERKRRKDNENSFLCVLCVLCGKNPPPHPEYAAPPGLGILIKGIVAANIPLLTELYGKRQTPLLTWIKNPASRKTWSCWRILSFT